MPKPRWRIVFIDDEPLVLRSIRASLRKYSDQFDCTFEEDSVKALDRIRSESFDVIVSDMRMPNVDGPSLLRTSAAIRPESVRIVLSGFADRSSMLRALTHSHRFLSKPCHPSELASELMRAVDVLECVGRDLPPHDTVLGMTSHTERMLQHDWNHTDATLAATMDPALMFRLLHATGTRFFGANRDRFSVEEAIQILGPDMVHELASGDSMWRPEGESGAKLDRLAKRNAAVGRVAAALVSNPDESELALCLGTMLSLSETMCPQDDEYETEHAKKLTAFTLGASGASIESCRAILGQDLEIDEPPEEVSLPLALRLAKTLVQQARGDQPTTQPKAILPSLWDDWHAMAQTLL